MLNRITIVSRILKVRIKSKCMLICPKFLVSKNSTSKKVERILQWTSIYTLPMFNIFPHFLTIFLHTYICILILLNCFKVTCRPYKIKYMIISSPKYKETLFYIIIRSLHTQKKFIIDKTNMQFVVKFLQFNHTFSCHTFLLSFNLKQSFSLLFVCFSGAL